jgi:hypothetical protein
MDAGSNARKLLDGEPRCIIRKILHRPAPGTNWTYWAVASLRGNALGGCVGATSPVSVADRGESQTHCNAAFHFHANARKRSIFDGFGSYV